MITVKAPLRSQELVDATRKKGHIVLGAGVGLLAVGFVTGWLSLAASDEARDLWEIETTRPAGMDTDDIQPTTTRAEVDKLVSRSRTLGIVSDVALGAGVVAVGIAAWFLVKGRPQGDRPTISLSPTKGGGALVGEVRW
jgi:hypothetical protein